ncbi:MAG: hypothetical protein V2J51_04490 [Erythrobacter sp.]|jgi:hypothetical protein|nr:hypothetical protein [Erythrobacter sp.]
MSELTDAKIIKYQFEVPIQRSASDIWPLMIDQIDDWWMDDFRALGEGSNLTLNAETGGQLIEIAADGSALEWYRVQMVVPGKALYLVGYMAPDWGGPTTSMLKLAIEEHRENCALVVSDALLGNVSEASASSAEGGWRTLFGDAFKAFVEG